MSIDTKDNTIESVNYTFIFYLSFPLPNFSNPIMLLFSHLHGV
jgi:hypothetical protein